MRIEKLTIVNFKIFHRVNLTFPKGNIAVFIGSNGKGKSSLLDAIAILLSQLVVKFQNYDKPQPWTSRPRNYFLADNDINIGWQEASLEICVSTHDRNFCWGVRRTRFEGAERKSQVGKKQAPELDNYFEEIKLRLQNEPDLNLPLLAHYRTDRIFASGNYSYKEQKKTYRHSQLSASDNAFKQGLNNFDDFVSWFRQEEDKENEQKIKERNFELSLSHLQAVRRAFGLFFKNLNDEPYSELRTERDFVQHGAEGLKFESSSTLVVKKEGQDFLIEQLSDGERVLMMLVCDIARRLAIANPGRKGEKALEGEGIVLIDELDLHLHPKWQRAVIPALTITFPNLQFIATTHSPQILSELRQEEVFILEEGTVFQASVNPMGKDTNAILEEVMETPKRPKEIEKLIEEWFSHINKSSPEKASQAKAKLLKRLSSDDPIFAKADAMMTRKQVIGR